MNDNSTVDDYDDDGVWLQKPAIVVQPELPAFESGLVTFVLVLLSGNLPVVVVHQLAGLKSLPIWPIYVSLYGLVGMFTVMRGGLAVRSLGAAAPVIFVSLLPLLSTVWSVTPVETALQAMALAGTTLVGFYLAAALPPMQALRLLAIAATFAPVLDLITILAIPSIGVHMDGPWEGTWKGLHDQKNGLGAYCALQILVVLTFARAVDRIPSFVMIALVLNVVLFVAAKSTTSWLSAAACIPLVLAPRAVSRLLGKAVPSLIVASGLLLLVEPDLISILLQELPTLVGKDSTLSNRLPVWEVLAPYIEAAPWLGYGYGAFWTETYMPAEAFMSKIYFLPGSAHSSVMELRLGFGWIGLVAVGLVIAHTIIALWLADSSDAASEHGNPVLPIALALFVYLLMQSLTECVLLVRNDLIWVLFVWLATSLSMAARDRHAVPSRIDD
jgi:exopolysaccharide production protein ExoQ